MELSAIRKEKVPTPMVNCPNLPVEVGTCFGDRVGLFEPLPISLLGKC